MARILPSVRPKRSNHLEKFKNNGSLGYTVQQAQSYATAMQILLFFSGIGIFLLAIQQLEQALSRIGKRPFRQSLQSFTQTPLQGIAVGLVATAIFQSSSIIGLITLAFVGAGILQLRNAIGIVLGSNLGTTFTGWLVTLLGFKLNLTEFYLPIMGLGAVGSSIFYRRPKSLEPCRLIFAFGMLLMGLSLMKDSIAFIPDLIDIREFKALPLFFYFVFGIVLTALIQSSSATMMISLSAINAGILDLPAAAALIIGADLGTTSTIILGAVQGSEVKKQVALVHVCFNVVTDIVAFAGLPLLMLLVTDIYGISDPLYALVATHSSFNLLGILLFLPFIPRLEALVQKAFPLNNTHPLFCSKVDVEVPDAAFEALEKDVSNLILTSIFLNERRFKASHSPLPEDLMTSLRHQPTDAIYQTMKRHENLLTDYIMELQRKPLTVEQSARALQLLVCIRDSLYAAKAMKDIQHDLDDFEQLKDSSIHAPLNKLYASVKRFNLKMSAFFPHKTGFTLGAFSEILDALSLAHSDFNKQIYALIDHQSLQQEQASTAFNINREILLSGHSLLNAVENYLLPREQAQTLSELLKIKR